MAYKTTSDEEITSLNQDWGGNGSSDERGNANPYTGRTSDGLPYSGLQVQKYLKGFIQKVQDECLQVVKYDTESGMYVAFSSQENYDKYVSDKITYKDLIRASWEAPAPNTAEINLVTSSVVSVLSGKTNNIISFTFDIKNKSGVSTGDSVKCTYNIVNGNGTSYKVQQLYNATTDVIDFNLDDYIVDGTNRITISIQGQSTLAATMVSITYNVVKLAVSTDFSIANYYNPGDSFNLYVLAEGSGTKYIDTYLDGVSISEENEDIITVSSGGKSKAITLASDITPGKHSLQVRAYISDGINKYYSETLYYEFAVVGSDTPVVTFQATLPSGTIIEGTDLKISMTQYDTIILPFALYDSKERTLSVAFSDGTSIFNTKNASNGTVDTSVSYFSEVQGEVTISATVSGATYSFGVTVNKSDVSYTKATNGLIAEFSAKGHSNTDTDRATWANNITDNASISGALSGVDFTNLSGWYENALVLSNGGSVTFNYAPFATNIATTGLTIEVDYMVDNGGTDDDVILMDLRKSTTPLDDNFNDHYEGLVMTPTHIDAYASDKHGFQHITATGTRHHLQIIFNRKDIGNYKGLFMTVMDGKIGYVSNYTLDNPFASDNLIKFGGVYSAVMRIYGMRIYNRALEIEECIGNTAIDSGDVKAWATRNNVYNNGLISYDLVKNRVASMKVIGDIPKLMNIQDKKTTITATVEFYDPSDLTNSWLATGVTIKNQGTSTLKFPIKNFSMNFKSAVFYDLLGNKLENFEGIKMRANSLPVWKLVTKADFMESSASFNTCGAISFNATAYNTVIKDENDKDTYPLRTAAQQYAADHNIEGDIRNAIDGRPITMFYQVDESSDVICVGQYDLNNGKDDCFNVYGFEGLDGYDASKTERWEGASEAGVCVFDKNYLSAFNSKSDLSNYWECVFPSEDHTSDNLKRFCTWVANLDNGDGTYNITKFESEYKDYLDIYKTAHYYIHIFIKNIGVDQVAKNMQLVTEDGLTWFPLYYDGDSAKFNDNDGNQLLKLFHWLADKSKSWHSCVFADRESISPINPIETNYFFQGHSSVLWNVIEQSEVAMNIIKKVIAAEYSAGLNYDSEIETFITNHTALIPECVYNQTIIAKYIDTFLNPTANETYLYVAQGDKQERVKLIADRRLKHYEAKWGYGGYDSRAFSYRQSSITTAIKDKTINVTAYADYWFGYKKNSTSIEHVEVKAGETYNFTIGTWDSGDIMWLTGADKMAKLDISAMMPLLSQFDAHTTSEAIHLTDLILSDGTGTNQALTTIMNLGVLKALERLDVRNYKMLTTVDVTNLSNLKYCLLSGTGITAFTSCSGAKYTELSLPILKELHLSQNTVDPTGFDYTSTSDLTVVDIDRVTGLPYATFLTSWIDALDKAEDSDALYKNAKIVMREFNISGINADLVISIGKIGTKTLQGTFNVGDITQEQYDQIVSLYGSNVFSDNSTLRIIANDSIFCTGNQTVYEGSTETYTGTVFPASDETIKFHLYDSSGSQISESNGIATTGNISLNCTTGVLTVGTLSADTTVYIAAYTSSLTSNKITILCKHTIDLTGVSIALDNNISGIYATGEYTGTITYTPSNKTVQLKNVIMTIEKI